MVSACDGAFSHEHGGYAEKQVDHDTTARPRKFGVMIGNEGDDSRGDRADSENRVGYIYTLSHIASGFALPNKKGAEAPFY